MKKVPFFLLFFFYLTGVVIAQQKRTDFYVGLGAGLDYGGIGLKTVPFVWNDG